MDLPVAVGLTEAQYMIHVGFLDSSSGVLTVR